MKFSAKDMQLIWECLDAEVESLEDLISDGAVKDVDKDLARESLKHARELRERVRKAVQK